MNHFVFLLLTLLIDSSENEKLCCICYDDFTKDSLTYTTPCKHTIHVVCLRDWIFGYNSNCPMCKADLSNCKTDIDSNCRKLRDLLYDASKRGDSEAVISLLAQGGDVNGQTLLGTPLYIAARNDDLAIVKILLSNGADVNLTVPKMNGSMFGLKANAGINADNGASTVLHFAAGLGNKSMVIALLEKRPDLNTQNSIGDTPLIIASSRGYSAIVQCLLTAGASPTLKTHLGKTAFQLTRETQCRELLAANKQEYNELLFEAVQNCDELAVDRSLAKGADINSTDSAGHTALMLASRRGRVKIVDTLLEAGADLSLKNDKGKTALQSTFNQECRMLLEAYCTSFQEDERTEEKRKRKKTSKEEKY